MNDHAPSSTLRDLRLHLTRPQVAAALAGAGIVLGLSGPFDTFASQPLAERLVYWALVVWLTYGAGFVVTARLHPRLSHLPAVLRGALTALAVTVVVFLLLGVLNLGFGQGPDGPASALASFGMTFAISATVEAAFQLAARAPAPQPVTPAHPALLDRLPPDRRGRLLSLSVQDHYVEVTTTRGRHLLLMRLGDAIRETAPERGMQIHRSHWVALAAIASATRRGDGAELTLTDGRRLPVSRARMAALRRAAVLPGQRP